MLAHCRTEELELEEEEEDELLLKKVFSGPLILNADGGGHCSTDGGDCRVRAAVLLDFLVVASDGVALDVEVWNMKTAWPMLGLKSQLCTSQKT